MIGLIKPSMFFPGVVLAGVVDVEVGAGATGADWSPTITPVVAS